MKLYTYHMFDGRIAYILADTVHGAYKLFKQTYKTEYYRSMDVKDMPDNVEQVVTKIKDKEKSQDDEPFDHWLAHVTSSKWLRRPQAWLAALPLLARRSALALALEAPPGVGGKIDLVLSLSYGYINFV